LWAAWRGARGGLGVDLLPPGCPALPSTLFQAPQIVFIFQLPPRKALPRRVPPPQPGGIPPHPPRGRTPQLGTPFPSPFPTPSPLLTPAPGALPAPLIPLPHLRPGKPCSSPACSTCLLPASPRRCPKPRPEGKENPGHIKTPPLGTPSGVSPLLKTHLRLPDLKNWLSQGFSPPKS